MKPKILFLIFLFLTTACWSQGLQDDLKVDRLRCEYLENPLGIDEILPRLSWIVTSESRGQKQTAYQIRVASSLEKLLSGTERLQAMKQSMLFTKESL
jgi:alpha-L-rhamnosidase